MVGVVAAQRGDLAAGIGCMEEVAASFVGVDGDEEVVGLVVCLYEQLS
jgi:hypothetical protein